MSHLLTIGAVVYSISVTLVLVIVGLVGIQIQKESRQATQLLLKWVDDQTEARSLILEAASIPGYTVTLADINAALLGSGRNPGTVRMRLNLMRTAFNGMTDEDIQLVLLTWADRLRVVDASNFYEMLKEARTNYETEYQEG